MHNDEIELKFPVADIEALQRRLPGLGLHLDTPRTLESNTLYDTPDRSLKEQRRILRIRHYNGLWLVTHKRPRPDNNDDSRYKVRLETQSIVENGPALGAIFEQLGFGPVFRYEKFRSEWSDPAMPGANLVLDETPIGNFAELEGPTGWIDQMVARLGIDPDSCITESYGRLFLAWKERTNSPADNLTFDEISLAKATL